jgi:hypothetical protein
MLQKLKVIYGYTQTLGRAMVEFDHMVSGTSGTWYQVYASMLLVLGTRWSQIMAGSMKIDDA